MEKFTNNCKFGKVLQDINKTIHKKEDEFLSKYNLTHFHSKYLVNLHIHGQMSMTELTENIGVDKANTTRAVKDLLDKGFIEKVGESERKFNLQLSKTGKEVAAKFKAKINNFFECVLKDFTLEEKITLQALIRKLFEGVKNVGNC